MTMTWEERWNMHKELRKAHSQKAIEAMQRFRGTGSKAYYEEYKAESKLSNKHGGIANAMFARKYGKI